MSTLAVLQPSEEISRDSRVLNRSTLAAVRLTVLEAAQRHLDEDCHFRCRAHLFEFSYVQGTLIVRGKVPSFYLKQLLQTTLRDVVGVKRAPKSETRIGKKEHRGLGGTGVTQSHHVPELVGNDRLDVLMIEAAVGRPRKILTVE